jgi:hypothetical protein
MDAVPGLELEQDRDGRTLHHALEGGVGHLQRGLLEGRKVQALVAVGTPRARRDSPLEIDPVLGVAGGAAHHHTSGGDFPVA